MFVSCKKHLSWHNCASLVPLGMEWHAAVLEMGDVFVFGCVWLCLVVSVCVVFVVLLVASVFGVDALAVVRW